jgi:hypothetical protein
MPFLNYNYGLVIYEDQDATNNPNIKMPDISISCDQIIVNNDKSTRGIVYPNQVKDISISSRQVLWDSTTELSFIRHMASIGSSSVRLYYTGTGTAPKFRINRNIGGNSDTTVSITRLNDYVARIQVVGGTAWDLSNVSPNDYLKIDSDNDLITNPFSAQNQNKELLVQAKGSDYIDFADNGVMSEDPNVILGADYNKVLKVVSQEPVLPGDIVEFNNTALNPSNQGRFEILNVSDDFIEFINPLAVAETFLYQSTVIYEYLIGFLHLRATGALKIKFGDQTEWVSLGTLGNQAVFFGSISTHRIQIKNDSPNTVSFSFQTCQVG